MTDTVVNVDATALLSRIELLVVYEVANVDARAPLLCPESPMLATELEAVVVRAGGSDGLLNC